ncbi:cytochrome b/b6 domain-containing protein [Aestuariispira ectoiniformans]|uniref:cytochrome b/b6 domain-containing protein n=1 Tax=Aestuariispira ectoiniformans TaxID=2775080 RepID=UPI0021E37C5A|nr:cytochrome b/b6 domain-containing protein [Aestuariispira ectoiniformans]
MSDSHGTQTSATSIKVWDIFVRLAHWVVATAFFIAYFTEDDVLTLHVWAGYTIGVFVILRIIWGFVGPRHARFADFLYGPFTIWKYLLALMTFKAKRHIGHSPAGGAMAIVLLIGLAATVGVGLELYATEKNAGPLASFTQVAAPMGDANTQVILQDHDDDYEQEEGRHGDHESGAGRFWKELHELLANAMLFFVILHIGGVILASIVHRENLTKAMITGYKRP